VDKVHHPIMLVRLRKCFGLNFNEVTAAAICVQKTFKKLLYEKFSKTGMKMTQNTLIIIID